MHIETIGYVATAPGATGIAAAAVFGDVLQIMNDEAGHANIVGWHAKNQLAGFHQVTFPSAHDPIRGYRVNVGVDELDPRLPWGIAMQPKSQEMLAITVSGSVTAGDQEIGILTLHYPKMRGIDGNYETFNGVLERAVKPTTVSLTLTPTGGAVVAGWNGASLIQPAGNALLHANTDYALFGFTCNPGATGGAVAIALRGPDNGGRRIACPADTGDNDFCQQYFAQLSRSFGIPAIPVFNTGNAGSTFFEMLCDENLNTALITAHLMELKTKRR